MEAPKLLAGKFRLTRRLGAGGTGSVYLARIVRARPLRCGEDPGRDDRLVAAPDSHQRRPSGPEHAACRGVLRSRVNRRPDSSGH